MKKLIDEMLDAKAEFIGKCNAVEQAGVMICGLPSVHTYISKGQRKACGL